MIHGWSRVLPSFYLISIFVIGVMTSQIVIASVPTKDVQLVGVLTAEQVEHIRDLAQKPFDTQLKEIKLKVSLELLKSRRRPGKNFFDSLGKAKRSVDDVSDIEGLYGKVVCPQGVEPYRIQIAENAPPSTLLHEYTHFLQISNTEKWCSFEGRPLEASERRERALLYHRHEFEVMRIMWEFKDKLVQTFEDKLIIVVGLNREHSVMQSLGAPGLDDVMAAKLEKALKDVQSEISLVTWSHANPDDAAAVLQKTVIKSLKSCVVNTEGGDVVKKINDCISKRCEFMGYKCQKVTEVELKKFDHDLEMELIHAWIKPYASKECSTGAFKEELQKSFETHSPCWKEWVLTKKSQRKEGRLEAISFQKIKKWWNPSAMKIDTKLTFQQAQKADTLIRAGYCYSVYEAKNNFDSLPLDQYAISYPVIVVKKDSISDYKLWLKKDKSGLLCSKMVRNFTGSWPIEWESKKTDQIIIHPAAALAEGIPFYKKTLSKMLTQERLKLVYEADKKIQKQVQKEWHDLSTELQQRFKKDRGLEEFDQDVVLQEYFSSTRLDKPSL